MILFSLKIGIQYLYPFPLRAFQSKTDFDNDWPLINNNSQGIPPIDQ